MLKKSTNSNNNNNNNDEQNFWISYADLMAGLLFVFVLLVGAIVIKYVFIQTDLQAIKTDLEKEKQALNLTEEQLENKKTTLTKLNEQLKNSKEKSLQLSFELAKTKNKLDETLNKLNEENKQNKILNLYLEDKNKQLQLSNNQIEKITAILNDKKDEISLLKKDMEARKKDIASKIEQIALNIDEIEKLKQLLLGYELKQKEHLSSIENLNQTINQDKNTINLKNEQLALLEKKLIIQSKQHQKLVEEFDIAKVKIKNLTGIRIKVVKTLKDKMGKDINIDPQSGALKFSSNILFNQNEFKLKETSKQELSLMLKKYIHTLLLDKNIKNHIDRIIIEGHTDTKGSYLYNLELSQKRALEVMKFLYNLEFEDKSILEKHIVASGRSYSQAIFENGVENKDASRRIEIKFELKNEQAIKEIENFLQKR